jgi:hypothetical protein
LYNNNLYIKILYIKGDFVRQEKREKKEDATLTRKEPAKYKGTNSLLSTLSRDIMSVLGEFWMVHIWLVSINGEIRE